MDMSHRASFGAALLLFSNVVSAGEILVSRLGSPFATVMAPGGQGSRDINVIRDGKKPATLSGVGRELAQLQYDTWDGTTPASKEWIGYQFASLQSFTRVVFQEGRHFPDGGFFDPPKSLVVQVRSAGGGWERAPGTWNPRYTGLLTGKAAISFETFTWIIDPPMLGDAIRIYGTPGGSADFISCAELEVYALSTAERPDVTMIEMADGSRFLGSFAAKELIVRTEFGALTIPLERITEVVFRSAQATGGESDGARERPADTMASREVTVVTAKFSIVGALDARSFDLKTKYGLLRAPREEILRIRFPGGCGGHPEDPEADSVPPSPIGSPDPRRVMRLRQ